MKDNINLNKAISNVMQFKSQKKFKQKYIDVNMGLSLLEDIPINGKSISDCIEEFNCDYLKYCCNESSVNNMGFPNSGDNESGLVGTIYSEFLQQNLINQSGSSPSITFAEINVIRWIREVVGYNNLKPSEIKNVFDVGGIVTTGGTMSNCVGMMLARENHMRDTMQKGVKDPSKFKVLIADGISHYSIKSSMMWLGLGNNLVYVKSENFKMDKGDLRAKLKQFKDQIMAVVLYAGDSRTMTIDDLGEVYDIVKQFDKNIWVHVDACHGFSLGFSDKLKYKIAGIEKCDSISCDAHKVLMVPYGLSIFVTKDPRSFELIRSESDLIMKEDFAFGQITPFIGSKNASCLKLWFLIKALGKIGLAEIVEKRHAMANYLHDSLIKRNDFYVLNNVGINSVMFLYAPKQIQNDLDKINKLNKMIFDEMNKEGEYYLHNFPITIPNNKFGYMGKFTPLRYMSGNNNITQKDIDEMVCYVKKLGDRIIDEKLY